MIDWLRRPPAAAGSRRDIAPTVRVGEAVLPLAIRRNARAKRLTLRLAPDGSEARVSMPRWARQADALAFAAAQAPWLARQLAAMPARYGLADGATVAWRGVEHRLDHDPDRPRRVVPGEGVLTIGGPAEGLERRLARWLQAQARVLFAADLAEYAARAGVPPVPLTLSGARARWGSCSARGGIRINWRLIMAPDFVRRSVVAHEVAHLVHFDHSPRFHRVLAAIYESDIATANAWLKAHGRTLYAVL